MPSFNCCGCARGREETELQSIRLVSIGQGKLLMPGHNLQVTKSTDTLFSSNSTKLPEIQNIFRGTHEVRSVSPTPATSKSAWLADSEGIVKALKKRLSRESNGLISRQSSKNRLVGGEFDQNNAAKRDAHQDATRRLLRDRSAEEGGYDTDAQLIQTPAASFNRHTGRVSTTSEESTNSTELERRKVKIVTSFDKTHSQLTFQTLDIELSQMEEVGNKDDHFAGQEISHHTSRKGTTDTLDSGSTDLLQMTRVRCADSPCVDLRIQDVELNQLEKPTKSNGKAVGKGTRQSGSRARSSNMLDKESADLLRLAWARRFMDSSCVDNETSASDISGTFIAPSLGKASNTFRARPSIRSVSFPRACPITASSGLGRVDKGVSCGEEQDFGGVDGEGGSKTHESHDGRSGLHHGHNAGGSFDVSIDEATKQPSSIRRLFRSSKESPYKLKSEEASLELRVRIPTEGQSSTLRSVAKLLSPQKPKPGEVHDVGSTATVPNGCRMSRFREEFDETPKKNASFGRRTIEKLKSGRSTMANFDGSNPDYSSRTDRDQRHGSKLTGSGYEVDNAAAAWKRAPQGHALETTNTDRYSKKGHRRSIWRKPEPVQLPTHKHLRPKNLQVPKPQGNEPEDSEPPGPIVTLKDLKPPAFAQRKDCKSVWLRFPSHNQSGCREKSTAAGDKADPDGFGKRKA